MKTHIKDYRKNFDRFREKVCQPETEKDFDLKLKAFRGQGYWIPELNDDVDIETIKSLLPEFEKKLTWIKNQKEKVQSRGIPKTEVTKKIREILKKLLELKKNEISPDEKKKISSRQESLKLQDKLVASYQELLDKVPFLTNFKFPVDHLKNRKVHDQYREKEDSDSVKISNYAFLYRKLVEDGAYNPDRTGPDIYLRTTLDTLHFELKRHDFYLSEDARYDLDFVLSKIESELARGKDKIVERLNEWEGRSSRAFAFYTSLTQPDHQKPIIVDGKKTTLNRQLINEHNIAADELRDFVYKKQAEVYRYWLDQPELLRAIFVIETILMNEVGAVDGVDALERMDVARVVLNRLDKPKYLRIGKKEFFYPHLKEIASEASIKNEKWLNALFKQGEFSFSYYYMGGVAKIFCPDMGVTAKKLRAQNIEIALQVLREDNTSFKATRYFSRASMIGRIHMDSVWEDYIPYPERAGLLAKGQEGLLNSLDKGDYSYLYSFKDPQGDLYQVLEIGEENFAMTSKNGIKIFYRHRNPHYFRYFSKIEN